MGTALLLVLWVSTTIFLCLKIESDRKKREQREWWLSDVKDCIYSIEREFQWNGKKITEDEFARPSFDEHRYRIRIRELEEKYKNELTEKVIAQKRVTVTTIPEHLVREYKRNISNIADTFLYFANFKVDNKDI